MYWNEEDLMFRSKYSLSVDVASKDEGNEYTDINYFHIEPNSHFFTSFEQLLECIKNIEHLGAEYIRIGIENSIKRGYKIIK